MGLIVVLVMVAMFFTSCPSEPESSGGGDDEPAAKSSEKVMESFKFEGLDPVAVGVIDQETKTVTINLPYKEEGTDVTGLVPSIEVSEKASVNPASGAPQDFSSDVTYTVTAEDGTTQAYTVSVTVAAADSKEITSFSIASQVKSEINESEHKITVTMLYNTDKTGLTPTIEINGASVNPASGVEQDFSSGVEYTVTAADDSTQVYTVSVVYPPAVTDTTITGLTAPVEGATPDTTAVDSSEGEWTVSSISWSPSDNPYKGEVGYTATISLSATTGYTFGGAATSWTVGAVSGTLAADTSDYTKGTVTVTFPATEAAVVTDTTITGLTAPVVGATPIDKTAIGGSTQWECTGIAWKTEGGSAVTGKFSGEVVYKAEISLSATTGFTFNDVAENSFTVSGAPVGTTVTNSAGSGTVTVTFPETAPAAVTETTITGLTAPVVGETPVTTITATDEYTGTVSWNPTDSPYKCAVVYTATISLSAKTGFTFNGIGENSFTVDGADSVTHSAGSNKSLTVAVTFPETAPAAESGFGTSPSIADTASIDVFGVTDPVTFAYASDGSFTIPTGTYDSGSEEIDTKFWMAKTETTNELAAAILQWAKDAGKLDTSNSSAHNYVSTTTVKYGKQELLELYSDYCKITYSSGTFSADSGFEQHPVVEVSWYGAIMLCNWLTEMRDGNTYQVVYTGIPTDGTAWKDYDTIEDITKKGYRLPESYEWECAVRYRGDDSTNTVSGYSNPYWTNGDSASGATADCNDATATGKVAWYSSNSNNATHKVAEKTANALGISDMSGNVSEWCFTESGSSRVTRGAYFGSSGDYLRCADWLSITPSDSYNVLGFRPCRTAD